MEENYSLLELLIELENDPSWREDAKARTGAIERMRYFLIEN